jgi:hypothetical protein
MQCMNAQLVTFALASPICQTIAVGSVQIGRIIIFIFGADHIVLGTAHYFRSLHLTGNCMAVMLKL